jgi:hypothetical protein
MISSIFQQRGTFDSKCDIFNYPPRGQKANQRTWRTDPRAIPERDAGPDRCRVGRRRAGRGIPAGSCGARTDPPRAPTKVVLLQQPDGGSGQDAVLCDLRLRFMRKMQHLPSRDNFCSGHSLSAVDSRNTRFHWFLILAFRNSLAPRSVSIFHDSGSSLMSIPLPHGPPDQENLSSLPQRLRTGR